MAIEVFSHTTDAPEKFAIRDCPGTVAVEEFVRLPLTQSAHAGNEID
jgi:hypothetical protein